MIEGSLARKQRIPPFEVKWVGAQRNVLDGDLSPHISLDSLEGLPDLYALGPLGGLKGEVTILESAPFISRVTEGGRVVVDSGFCHGACFLAYSQVRHWREVVRPAVVLREAELEWFLPEAAAAAGIDPGEPFPYLLKGTPRMVEFHILNKNDGLPHNRERHEQSKSRFRLRKRAVTIIGFYSQRHRGVFTPGESSIHQHLVARDGTVAGHVDRIFLTREVRLFLPDVGQQ